MTATKPLIVFDLDGTILDSLQDIAGCCNQALEQCGFPTHPPQRYKEFVGHGVDNLLRQALPPLAAPRDFNRLHKRYMKLYLELCQQGGTLFPQVPELLQLLRAQGALLAVVSNKPHEHTCAVCRVLFANLLDGWLGQYPDIALKPQPAGVRAMEAYLNGRCIAFVGDSDVDVQTGHNLGVPAVAVSWGMQSRAALEAAKPSYLAENCDALKQILLDILHQY